MAFWPISSENLLIHFSLQLAKKHKQIFPWKRCITLKSANITCLYGTIYLYLDDYPPYYDKQSDIFGEKINKNLRCCHGYTNYVVQKQLITWVSKNTWENFHSEFPQASVINNCPRTTICNYCEEINVSGDTLYAGGNDEKQEDFGF